MSAVDVLMVKAHNTEATFVDPFAFEVTFEAHRTLPHDLEWKLIYVGSAGSSAFDQTLESVLVGPIRPGKNRFQLPAPAPNPTKIPKNEILGVTIVLLTCSYKEQEFIRIGYYVSNTVAGQEPAQFPNPASSVPIKDEDDSMDDDDDEDEDEEDDEISLDPENEVAVPGDLRQITRRILADKPRVTKFPIDWDIE